MENEEHIYHEIEELKKKYEYVINKIDVIEKESKETENSIKRIENNFAGVNNNFEEIMKKLDNMSEEKDSSAMFNNMKQSSSSLKNMITKPIRKIAVGTISSILGVVDYASEKVSCAREGVEDVVAEAQYKNKSRRFKSNGMPDMVPNE